MDVKAVEREAAKDAEIERLREGRDTMGNLWAKEKAENERLRGENERLRGHIYASNRPQPEEFERLRDALWRIVRMGDDQSASIAHIALTKHKNQ